VAYPAPSQVPVSPQPLTTASLPGETLLRRAACICLDRSSLPPAFRAGLALPAGYIPLVQRRALLCASSQAVGRLSAVGVCPGCSLPTVVSGVSFLDVQSAWAGAAADRPPLLVDESTLALFSGLWGAPASGAVEALPAPIYSTAPGSEAVPGR